MKKLIMTAVVAIAAIGVNAATVNWTANKGYIYDGAATPAKVTSGNAYLVFVTSAFGQEDAFNAFKTAAGKSDATVTAIKDAGALATGTGAIGSNARIGEGTSTYNLTGDGTAYFVVFANDKMYMSITGLAEFDPVTQEASLNFDSVSATSKLSYDTSAGFKGAAWYSMAAAPVPEPTSGLLMLLGIAGLALKRRRA